mgnify:CR=1 FL=1
MRELLVMLFILVGAFLMFLAGIGILRMPDLFLRMSSTAKAGTLGAGLIVLGAALYFNEFSLYTRAVAIIIFILITSPVAAHMIGRAAYFDGVPLWRGTIRDDLHGHYHSVTHSLETLPVSDDEAVKVLSEADDFEEEN